MSRSNLLVVVSDARDGRGIPADLVVGADRYLEGDERLSDPDRKSVV